MLRVWAPQAKRVELETQGSLRPMREEKNGWWVADDILPAGSDYKFRLDGEKSLPDPRSAFQPRGVHAASRIIDHGQFRWTDGQFQARPLASAIVYELHIGTFTSEGNFEAAIERLDHLVDLGVTHVEIMPVAEWDGPRGWGYDGVALYAPHAGYGGPEGLKRLVDACHARGLAAILDVVYNHLGPSGNYLPQYGPYFTDRHHTSWGSAVNFDGAGSDEVRQFVVDNVVMWLRDYHFDCLRLDAVDAIMDNSALHILEEIAQRVHHLQGELGRHLAIVAESDLNDPRIIRPREIGGYGIDAQWNDDFHHAVHAALTGETSGYYCSFGRLGDVAEALKRGYLYTGNYSPFRKRRHGRAADDLPGSRFVACIQNHDQVGNRAQGDRLGQLVSRGRQQIGAALLLTSPFVPMLFQGEEWAASSPFQYFTSFDDVELGRAVSAGRRNEFRAFGWKPESVPDPQDPATFERSKLRWEEIDREPHTGMLAWYRELIALRRRVPHLGNSRMDLVETRHDEDRRWLAIERGPITIVTNLDGAPQDVPLRGSRPRRVLLASDKRVETRADAVRLPAESVAILGE